jgi:hypothetical protein
LFCNIVFKKKRKGKEKRKEENVKESEGKRRREIEREMSCYTFGLVGLVVRYSYLCVVY